MAIGPYKFIRKPWTIQPQGPVRIDWSNPLTRGLVFVHQGVPFLPDLVSGRAPNVVGTVTPTIVGPMGRSYGFGTGGSSGTVWYTRDAALEPSDAVTALGFVRRTGTLPAYSRPFGKTYFNGGASPYLSYDIEYNPAGAGQSNVGANITASGPVLISTPTLTSIDSTIPHVVGLSYDRTTLKLWQNGRVLTSVVGGGPLVYDTSASGNFIVSGSHSGAASNAWAGDIYLVAVWNRALTDIEQKSFSNNPWQVFAPVPPAGSNRLSAIGPTSITSAITNADTSAGVITPVTDAIISSIFRKPWTIQPQGLVGIDWSNPLTRGLDGALLPAGGTGYDSVSGKIARWHYSSQYHSVGVGAHGRTFLQSNPSDDIRILGTTLLTSITAVAIISLRSFPLAQNHLYSADTSNANGSVSLRLNTDGTVSLCIFDYYGGQVLKTFTTTVTVPINMCSVVIGNVTKDYTVSIFINGVNVFTQLAAVSGFGYTGAYGPFFDAVGPRGYDSPIYTASGPFSHYGLLSYKIALSAAEIKSLSANPWQVFAPAQSVSNRLSSIGPISAGVITPIVSITSAITNGADTSAGVITPIVSITSATTNGADTSAGVITPIVSITSAITNGADTSAGVITPIAQIPSNINPIYTRVADIQGGVLLGNASTTISTTSVATDYTGQPNFNIPVFTADATNGGYIQKIRFKAAGTNATVSLAKIYLNEGKLNTLSPAGIPGTPTGAPSITGGTLNPGSYFAKVQAIDSWGGYGVLSAESAEINVTTTQGSIVWSWTAATGPVAYYRIYVGTTIGGEYSYFDTSSTQPATTTFTQTAPFVANQFANPIDYTTTNMLIGEIALPTTTAGFVALMDIDFPINRALPPGYRIFVGMHSSAILAAGWVVTAFGGKY